MLLVVERSLRRVGRVLGLLQTFLEFAVAQLALVAFGAELLLEALLALGRPRPELVEGRTQAVDGAGRQRRFVHDQGAQQRVQRTLRLPAGTLDRERRLSYAVKLGAHPAQRQA